jgi:imidazolonepropionase-like amidohydrolase
MKYDVHMHMILDGQDWRAAIGRHSNQPDEAFIHAVLGRYRDVGYTYLRDGGDRWGAGKRARELAVHYGIRYRTPLANLCRLGHYGGFIGEKYENLREYADLVKKHRSEGADFIKVMISGLMDFDRFGRLSEEGLPPEEIRQLVHIAHEEGFAIMAHANGPRTMEAAAAAGMDSIEHGAYADADALSAMAEMGTVWVPTVSTVINLKGKGRFDEAAVDAIASHTAENLRQFAAMGGLIACGSDAGAWAVPHGCNTEEAHLHQILGDDAPRILTQGNQIIMDKF